MPTTQTPYHDPPQRVRWAIEEGPIVSAVSDTDGFNNAVAVRLTGDRSAKPCRPAIPDLGVVPEAAIAPNVKDGAPEVLARLDVGGTSCC